MSGYEKMWWQLQGNKTSKVWKFKVQNNYYNLNFKKSWKIYPQTTDLRTIMSLSRVWERSNKKFWRRHLMKTCGTTTMRTMDADTSPSLGKLSSACQKQSEDCYQWPMKFTSVSSLSDVLFGFSTTAFPCMQVKERLLLCDSKPLQILSLHHLQWTRGHQLSNFNLRGIRKYQKNLWFSEIWRMIVEKWTSLQIPLKGLAN